MAVVMLVLLLASCGNENAEVVEVVFDPETTYTMKTTDVSNLVSDSGVIRYKFIADKWYVYDKAAEPYWLFPEGIYLERYDSLFNIDASVKADTAYNYTKKEIWELIGNVEVLNLKGERFETEHLFWDSKAKKIYSDKYIRIENEEKIITGIGFESNQDLTKYDVFNSQGVFPVRDTPADTTETDQSLDSTALKPEENRLELELNEKK